jgi:hypothetical protein
MNNDAEVSRLRTLLAEVADVLKPFVEEASNYCEYDHDDEFLGDDTTIRVGHIRAARSVAERIRNEVTSPETGQ